jgi:hypothetical protein
MSIRYLLLILAAIFFTSSVFAEDDMNLKSCAPIVKMCLGAGYTHNGSHGKQFWEDCMKPLLLGKTVSGVIVDAKEVKTCRDHKIEKLKQELSQFEAVQ